MTLTPDEKSAITAALRGLEAFAALIPPPGGAIVLAVMHSVEALLEYDRIDPETIEELRAGVYDRLQGSILKRFEGP